MLNARQQFVSIDVSNETGEDAVFFGIAICPSQIKDFETILHVSKNDPIRSFRDHDTNDKLFLPIGMDTGNLEEIRSAVIQQVNDVFDAAQGKGKFSK